MFIRPLLLPSEKEMGGWSWKRGTFPPPRWQNSFFLSLPLPPCFAATERRPKCPANQNGSGWKREEREGVGDKKVSCHFPLPPPLRLLAAASVKLFLGEGVKGGEGRGYRKTYYWIKAPPAQPPLPSSFVRSPQLDFRLSSFRLPLLRNETLNLEGEGKRVIRLVAKLCCLRCSTTLYAARCKSAPRLVSSPPFPSPPREIERRRRRNQVEQHLIVSSLLHPANPRPPSFFRLLSLCPSHGSRGGGKTRCQIRRRHPPHFIHAPHVAL